MEVAKDEIKTTLTDLDSVLNGAISKLWTGKDGDAHLELLVAGAEEIAGKMIEAGNTCWERIERGGKTGVSCYVIHFLWPARAKAFLILWRDVLFEQQKARMMAAGGQLSGEKFVKLQQASRRTLEEAAAELKAYPEKEIQAARRGRGGAAQQMRQWKLMENPWPTYREQLAFLSAQCRCLLDEHLQLRRADEGFEAIRELIGQAVATCERELGEMEKISKDNIAFIEEHVDAPGGPKPGRIASRLEDIEAGLEAVQHLTIFNKALEQELNGLPEKTQVSVHIDAGMIQYKEINFRRSVRQWLESEVLPVLYEIWELVDNVRQSLQMSLVNIRNRALLLATEAKEGRTSDVEGADLCQPLHAFSKKLKAQEDRLQGLWKLIEGRLNAEFRLSAVYRLFEDFLPIPLQSTINQLGIGRSKVLDRGARWWRELTGRFQQFKTSVEVEESMGVPEKIVRFIRSRTYHPENHHYTSIFLTKGYIGESFWVGRETELTHMETLIDNWRLGFRGGVILSGQRFTGKSLFGELIANRFFPKDTIRLAPKTTIRVQGRHMTSSHDLGESLEFIRKYSLNNHPLVWIDDLEVWSAPEMPLSKNVHALRKYMDNYGGRIFFMISMSNWLKAHLFRFHEMEKVFQAEINLDRIPAADIREAILIRHGATHKTLVDDQDREATPPQFRKMTNRIAKIADGNIGEALNWWAVSTKKVDEDKVIHQFESGYPLPDFITPDSALVLSTIMLEKRTNEYRLRKTFGPAFSEKYGGIVQRLISLGVLTRHADGWLEINELVVNEVGRLLENKRYLQFHHT
jgi:hypothetical protein